MLRKHIAAIVKIASTAEQNPYGWTERRKGT
jgi:hypothetical protein